MSHYACNNDDSVAFKDSDLLEDSNPFPDAEDPSHFTGPLIGELPDGLVPANEGAFEGGDSGTAIDAEENNAIAEADQRDDGKFNVPTNGPPSPLFGAAPFSQQMFRFEEFGTKRLRLNGDNRQPPDGWKPLPAPVDARSTPDGAGLEAFLAQGIYPTPTKFANDRDENPWRIEIESFLGRSLDSPPAEGRPPGLGWSHQRWEEFKPEVYFQTAAAGTGPDVKETGSHCHHALRAIQQTAHAEHAFEQAGGD